MTAPTVFLVDDQPAVLKALARLLAAAGYAVRTFASAQAFLDSDAVGADGCLVLDLSMPDMDGLALQQALVRRDCLLPLIFLTGHGDIDSGVRAIKLGAADFLTKPVDDVRLMAAVARALEPNRQAQAGRAERDDILARLRSLTPRETEVLDLIVEGLLNKQVAAALGTVEKTVKVHRARVMAKMRVRSMTALVRLVDRVRTGAPVSANLSAKPSANPSAASSANPSANTSAAPSADSSGASAATADSTDSTDSPAA